MRVAPTSTGGNFIYITLHTCRLDSMGPTVNQVRLQWQIRGRKGGNGGGRGAMGEGGGGNVGGEAWYK